MAARSRSIFQAASCEIYFAAFKENEIDCRLNDVEHYGSYLTGPHCVKGTGAETGTR